MHTLDQLRHGQLAGTQKLAISSGLTTFPDEIFDLADSLEILDLSNNQLRDLPDTLPRLHKLSILFLNHNAFETVPEVLAQCPNLTMIGFKANRLTTLPEQALPPQTRWLILTDNQLTTLPQSIGSLKRLQKLMLAGNQLQTLPEEMAACLNLELVRLAANQLGELPPWLLTLPRLAWLAYAGNPFCQSWSHPPRPTAPLPTLDWADLTPGAVLGEGASGVIAQGVWQTARAKTEVAIKLFKGQITSDGYPEDEMRACLAAGTQANLISPIGQVVNHPDQKQGLVFPLIPSSYSTLGGPPSLDTCTRDTYPATTRFTLPVVWRIATSLAAAAAHLHQRGILHGDLYAHNTLVNPEGTALLGDFGAASFYPTHPQDLGAALERIEVRAFGCLLEDLLDRCLEPGDDRQVALTQALRSLQQSCMKPTPQMRPLFGEILTRLQELSP
ncbi:MAG TPA: serine/threonine-protein kinase [Leptolyngbyaceae cyanobacterium M65_K2018_010]|nr:serine/threonine-protein kinase [Leptolyngbyaceae cyanobacterium M65_K2018_010]